VLREEHRPPFLVFCDECSLAEIDFLKREKKREVAGEVGETQPQFSL